MRKHLDGDRLQAARVAGGFDTWNRLAARLGVPHSTISRMRNRRVQKVNEATLKRLSEILRVPADWLTGERRDLPYMPQFHPADTRVSLWERPSPDYVLYSWLMQGVEQAVRRDLTDWCGDGANEAYDAWGRALIWAFAKLASSVVWRVVTLQATRGGSPAGLLASDDAHTIRWLAHILDTWIRGDAYLNADHLRALFQAFANGSDMFKNEVRDADALRAFGRYETLCHAAVQRQLEEVGPEEDEGDTRAAE